VGGRDLAESNSRPPQEHSPGGAMPALVPADGAVLSRILDAAPPAARDGLSRAAFATLDRATRQTPWAQAHRQRFALVDGGTVIASAARHRLAGTLDGRPVEICGIGSVQAEPTGRDDDHPAADAIEQLTDRARQDGADIALLFAPADRAWPLPAGFEPIPTTDVEIQVIESERHGAPMTPIRGGEDRDLAAIVAMGDVRAQLSRFHLDRDVDFVKYVLTRRRLLAGLAPAGRRQLHFVIAEEGLTAAAYLMITAVDGAWFLEECGDRDASGARVGAILQAMIAREPVERRPVIRGWLPPAFVPPQLRIVAADDSPPVVFAQVLSPRLADERSSRLAAPLTPPPSVGLSRLGLATGEALFWRNDVL
jgi:hypothetical protein